jgi:hypothetical protein
MEFHCLAGPSPSASRAEQNPALVRLIDVKRTGNQPGAFPSLAAGQLWRMKHAYVRIVEPGKELIRFQMLDALEENGARVQTSEIETLWGYLKSRHAQLVATHRAAFDPFPDPQSCKSPAHA